MINKYELLGILASVSLMALALFLLRIDNTSSILNSSNNNGDSQVAALSVVTEGGNNEALRDTVAMAVDKRGQVEKMIINDVHIGTGNEVKEGDTVTVHYIGTLRNGQQFDNSYNNDQPLTFTLGEGKVIAGWETGLLGMKVGGQRVLVIPPELAYGKKVMGPIPANSTLIFAVELIAVQ